MVLATTSVSWAQSTDGAEIYATACAACHAADGRGQPQTVVGFHVPLPDFTDCSFATREPDADWLAIAHSGGPVRAFDRLMPAFGDALAEEQLQRALDYIRGFCPERAWPRGELNLPRALVTEKAYPEDEAVLTVAAAGGDTASLDFEWLYERRVGPRSQFEIAAPVELQHPPTGWQRGLGDIAVAVKHAFFHSLPTGRIVSVAAEVVLPTGKEALGFGKGVTIFELFVAFGQMLPADGFVQAQAGFELPVDPDRVGREAFWRLTLGRSFTQGRFGRTWSPMVELLGASGLESADDVRWDILPQVQVTLSRRQHVMVNVGLRFAIGARERMPTQVVTYLLWDWFDGGFLEGWR